METAPRGDSLSEIVIINNTWFTVEGFLWPPIKLVEANKKQNKFLNLFPDSEWVEITEFEVLKSGLSNS